MIIYMTEYIINKIRKITPEIYMIIYMNEDPVNINRQKEFLKGGRKNSIDEKLEKVTFMIKK